MKLLQKVRGTITGGGGNNNASVGRTRKPKGGVTKGGRLDKKKNNKDLQAVVDNGSGELSSSIHTIDTVGSGMSSLTCSSPSSSLLSSSSRSVGRRSRRRGDARVVQFEEDQIEVIPYPSYDDDDDETNDNDDLARRWYTEDDCRRMKKDHQCTLQTLCRSVATSFHEVGGDSYARALAAMYEACRTQEPEEEQQEAVLPTALQLELEEHCQLWTDRTGLEHKLLHFLCSNHYYCKSSSNSTTTALYQSPRSRMTDVVLFPELLEVRNKTTHETARTPEELRVQCQAISRPSCLFAQALAQAQQLRHHVSA